MAAPAALSLIAVTFPEGPPRNRALGVYASMTVAGAAAGLIAGGLLVSCLSWRWVFFVNVPIGLVVAALATRVLPGSRRRTGIAFLPLVAVIILASGIASQAVNRIGARPLLIAGSASMAGGMFWLSRITEHCSYAGGLPGPMLITATGLGLLFVPMTLIIALAAIRVTRQDLSGVDPLAAPAG